MTRKTTRAAPAVKAVPARATMSAIGTMTSVATMEQVISPLLLADRLLSLAEDAGRAGLQRPAERLLRLAYAVYAEKPPHAQPCRQLDCTAQ